MTINRRRFIQAGAAVAAGSAIAWPMAAQAATVLDLSEVLPEENWQTVEIRKFAKAVLEATSGEVDIRIHSGGALGFKGPEHLRTVADGLVPMADLLGSQQVGEEPFFKLENLPFLVRNQQDLLALHKYWRPEIDRIASEKFNQKFLTAMPSPTNCIYLNIKTDDIGQFNNVRVRGAAMIDVEIFDHIGFAGIQIPWGELIPALASGRVDGVGTSPTSAVDGKFWEFMKYIYPTNHVWASNFITINLEHWNKLSAANQETLLALSAEYQPQFWAASKNLGDKAFETLVSHGMELLEMPEGLLKTMQDRTQPLIDKYVADVPQAGPIIASYLKDVGRA